MDIDWETKIDFHDRVQYSYEAESCKAEWELFEINKFVLN